MYAVLMFLSLVGNLLIVAVFYRNKTLRTPVHCFIVNMAISDLIIPVIFLPYRIADAYCDGVWLVEGVLGTIFCKFVQIAFSVSGSVSILSIVAIAFDRFYAIIFAIKPPLISQKICRQLVALTWIFSVTFRLHFLIAYRLVYDEHAKLSCEFEWEPAKYTRTAVQFTLLSFLCFFIISAIVLTVSYTSIIIFLYRQKSQIHGLAPEAHVLRARENRRVTGMLVVIVVVFFSVWIPHYISVFLYFLKPETQVSCFIIWFGRYLRFSYIAINPIIYYIFNENYRQGFRELLSRLWPCNSRFSECYWDCFKPISLFQRARASLSTGDPQQTRRTIEPLSFRNSV